MLVNRYHDSNVRAGVRLLNKQENPNFPVIIGDGREDDWSIIYRTDAFLSFSRSEIFDSTKLRIVSASMLDARLIVQTEYDGFDYSIHFYRSTGMGKKTTVPSDRFYYMIAYNREDERIVKLPEIIEHIQDEDHEDVIRTHGNIPFLQAFTRHLDETFG